MKKNPWESKRGIKALLAMGWTNRYSWVGMDWVLARSKAIDWLDVQVKAGRIDGFVLEVGNYCMGWFWTLWLRPETVHDKEEGRRNTLDSALIDLVLAVAKLPVQP